MTDGSKYEGFVNLQGDCLRAISAEESKAWMAQIAKVAQEARREALKRGIDANAIVISERYKWTRHFFVKDVDGTIRSVPPMLCGMRVLFDELGEMPEDVAFLVMHAENLPEEETVKLRSENEELKEKLERIRGLTE